MISVLQQPANLPVSPRKDTSLQITGLCFMIIERDTLDMKLLRQMIMLGAKLLPAGLVLPTETACVLLVQNRRHWTVTRNLPPLLPFSLKFRSMMSEAILPIPSEVFIRFSWKPVHDTNT